MKHPPAKHFVFAEDVDNQIRLTACGLVAVNFAEDYVDMTNRTDDWKTDIGGPILVGELTCSKCRKAYDNAYEDAIGS